MSTGWLSLVAKQDGPFLGIEPTGNLRRWRIMDFWEGEDDYLIRNWGHIDMIDIFKQMGAAVLEWLRASGSVKR